MGIEQLQAELAQEMAALTGLNDQIQFLNFAYLNAFERAKPRIPLYGISKDRLEALESTRSEIKAQIQAVYGNIISRQRYYAPILRLPAELTIQIFRSCWDNGEISIASCSRDTVRTLRLPWHLSATCRIWREIAIQLPCLWSNIILSFGAVETSSFVLKIWTQRCGPHPASLYWLRPSGSGDVTIQPGRIQKLRFALKKIRAINVRTLQASQVTRRMSVEHQASHRLALQRFQQGIDLLHGRKRNLFKDMNELRWVAPRLSWDSSPLILIVLRATNITDSTFALGEDTGLLQMLSYMPRLEQANLFIPLQTWRSLAAMETAGPEILILPSLRTLRIASHACRHAAYFLRHFITPKLQALDLALGPQSYASTMGPYHFPPRELMQFLEQSHCNIQHLGIQDASNPPSICHNYTLRPLLALQNVKNSLCTCYIQAHHHTLSNPRKFAALLGKMSNMLALHIGSAGTAITLGRSLTQEMSWVDNILCEEESAAYFEAD